MPNFNALPLELQEMTIKFAIWDDLRLENCYSLPYPDSFGSLTFQLARVNSLFYTLVEDHVDKRLDQTATAFGSTPESFGWMGRAGSLGRCIKHGRRLRWSDTDQFVVVPPCWQCSMLRGQAYALLDLLSDLHYWQWQLYKLQLCFRSSSDLPQSSSSFRLLVLTRSLDRS